MEGFVGKIWWRGFRNDNVEWFNNFCVMNDIIVCFVFLYRDIYEYIFGW